MRLELRHPHRFDLAPYEAQQLQKRLQEMVVTEDAFGDIKVIVGIEVSQSRYSDQLSVGVAALSYPGFTVLERKRVDIQTKFPFIPELLSFREVAGIVEALDSLTVSPDLLLVDGPGIAHPKGLGLASHLGVIYDLPAIGCARSTSIGTYIEPEVNAGSESSLVWQSEIIGTVLRSKNRVAPLFISPGHRVGRLQAARFVREACHGYRLPEPIRMAGLLLTETKSSAKSGAVIGK